MPESLLRVSEVAKRMHVTTRTIVRWITVGYFPKARKLGPGRNSPYVIPEADVIALEKQLRGETEAPDEN